MQGKSRFMIYAISLLICCENAFGVDNSLKNGPSKIEQVNSKNLTGQALRDFISYKSSDHFLGNSHNNAKVTVVEYGALTCAHCAHVFLQILPKLQKEYLNKNKDVIFIHRSFVNDAPSLRATQLLECNARISNSQYFKLLNVLYQSQTSWAYSKDYEQKLLDIALAFGVQKFEFINCMKSKVLETKILLDRMDTFEKVGLRFTPVIFVNGRIVQTCDYNNIAKLIEEELSRK